MPSCISPRRFYFVTFQPSADSQNALSFQVLSENTLDYLRLFLVDDKVAFIVKGKLVSLVDLRTVNPQTFNLDEYFMKLNVR